jgi:hypothetical protein
MAILFADGFDFWGSNEHMVQGPYAAAEGDLRTPGRTGSKCYYQYYNKDLRVILPRVVSGFGVAFGFKTDFITVTDLSAATMGQFCNISNDILCSVELAPNGSVRMDLAPNPLYSPPGSIKANTWQHVEMFFSIATGPGNGFAAIAIDGVLVATGAHSNGIGSTPLAMWRNWRGLVFNSAAAPGTSIDDLVIWDTSGDVNNDFIGDVRCRYIAPVADLAPQDWALSSGADAFALIGNVDPDDANYIDTNTINAKSKFRLGQLPPQVDKIKAICISQRQFKSDAGAAVSQTKFNAGGGTVTFPAVALTTGPSTVQHVAEINPGTLAPYTPAEFNFDATATIERIA